MKTKRPAMGKGLSALLEANEVDIPVQNDISLKYHSSNFAMISLENITANPFQPRTVFEEQALNELVESIKKQGIIQPVTVRKVGDDKFQLISGGRRYKAARIAGLTEIPVYIKTADDVQMLEMALVENIQREDLDPIEIAVSFQMLIEECKLTHEQLSRNVGKNRTTITNYLRLLKLPAEIQIALRKSQINMGHARALINIDDRSLQTKLFRDIVKNDLSVRRVEDIARNISAESSSRSKTDKPLQANVSEYNSFHKEISEILNTKVDIRRNKNGRGSIIISFTTDEDLKRIIDFLNKK